MSRRLSSKRLLSNGLRLQRAAIAALLFLPSCSSRGERDGNVREPAPEVNDDRGVAAPDPVNPEVGSRAEGSDVPIPLVPDGPEAPRATAVEADAGSPGTLPAAPGAVASGPLRVFIAGDSIVQSYADTASERDQAGWGQMLPAYFDGNVRFFNHAIGGRTARRFIDEGRLDVILEELATGDTLLVEFGTNDGNRTATYPLGGEDIPYYLDPATDFKAYLSRYIEEARGRQASVVLVTPTPRNSAYCTGGNGTGAHAAAMRELGEEQGVSVVDLNARAVEYLRAICPAPAPEDFFLLRADGTVDGTHFQENGARILAGFVSEGIRSSRLPLASHAVASR
jgi:lysophospholipase L1-like esterase